MESKIDLRFKDLVDKPILPKTQLKHGESALVALPAPELNSTLARLRGRYTGKMNRESIVLFKSMPDSFTSKEFLKKADEFAIPERTCYVYLRQYEDTGCLVRRKLGHYRKTPLAKYADQIIIRSVQIGNSLRYEGYTEAKIEDQDINY